ncbi:hypothetical protein BS78_K186200 [Paspalum vaginatum]|nr:hypothetical protein BS78_K186200 [Paspalum vaginatum]
MSSSASPAPAAHQSRRPLRGVVFDMGGTLAVPVIDFPAMYREDGGALSSGGGGRDGGRANDKVLELFDLGKEEKNEDYEKFYQNYKCIHLLSSFQ